MISALVMLILTAMSSETVDTLGLPRNLVKCGEYLISFSSAKTCLFYIIKKYNYGCVVDSMLTIRGVTIHNHTHYDILTKL